MHPDRNILIIEKKNIHHIVIHIRQNQSPFVKS